MKKTLTMVLAFALIFALGIGATLAWLTATSTPVTNTFTTSDINITLTESPNLNLKMVPGHTITKDPKVTVVANSEPCYLFVKVEKSNNFDKFMTYAMADGWTQLTKTVTENGETKEEPVTGVFYREVNASTSNQVFEVLANNRVTVRDTVTKDMMTAINNGTASAPTLTFTAYATQRNSSNDTQFSAFEAWEKVAN